MYKVFHVEHFVVVNMYLQWDAYNELGSGARKAKLRGSFAGV
jgi:hypothetical protein